MRFGVALLLALSVQPSQAAAPADPLAGLIEQLSAPLDDKASAAPGGKTEDSAKLAQIQASLTVAAAGFEALRSPTHARAAREALEAKSDPALKPALITEKRIRMGAASRGG